MGKHQTVWVKKKFEEMRAQCGNRYELCGIEGVELQFAHIKPTKLTGRGRGLIARYYDIKKNPNSYVLACEGCHEDFDSKVVDNETRQQDT